MTRRSTPTSRVSWCRKTPLKKRWRRWCRSACRPDATPPGGDVLGGKELSYTDLLDLDAAWRAVGMFEKPAVVIVKHLNPTGIAIAPTAAEALPRALESDPVSAFGGVIAVN